MYAKDIRAELLADVPRDTDPMQALRVAEGLLAYCLQYPDVFCAADMSRIRLAMRYADAVVNPAPAAKLDMKKVLEK